MLNQVKLHHPIKRAGHLHVNGYSLNVQAPPLRDSNACLSFSRMERHHHLMGYTQLSYNGYLSVMLIGVAAGCGTFCDSLPCEETHKGAWKREGWVWLGDYEIILLWKWREMSYGLEQ